MSKIYYGPGKLPKNKTRYATKKEAIKHKQVRYWGTHLINGMRRRGVNKQQSMKSVITQPAKKVINRQQRQIIKLQEQLALRSIGPQPPLKSVNMGLPRINNFGIPQQLIPKREEEDVAEKIQKKIDLEEEEEVEDFAPDDYYKQLAKRETEYITISPILEDFIDNLSTNSQSYNFFTSIAVKLKSNLFTDAKTMEALNITYKIITNILKDVPQNLEFESEYQLEKKEEADLIAIHNEIQELKDLTDEEKVILFYAVVSTALDQKLIAPPKEEEEVSQAVEIKPYINGETIKNIAYTYLYNYGKPTQYLELFKEEVDKYMKAIYETYEEYADKSGRIPLAEIIEEMKENYNSEYNDFIMLDTSIPNMPAPPAQFTDEKGAVINVGKKTINRVYNNIIKSYDSIIRKYFKLPRRDKVNVGVVSDDVFRKYNKSEDVLKQLRDEATPAVNVIEAKKARLRRAVGRPKK